WRCVNEKALEDGKKYWKEQLSGISDLDLPADHIRPARPSYSAGVHEVILPQSQSLQLREFSRRNQATLYMTLLATFGLLLSRYCGQDDIVVGSPIANRQDEQLEEMIGFFVNSLVMRMKIRPGVTVRDLLSEVRRTALEAYQHQDVPFEWLVEELSP